MKSEEFVVDAVEDESISGAIEVLGNREDVLIKVGGEVDLSLAPKLLESFVDAMRNGARRVTVEMTEVTFVDSSALGVLVSAHNRAKSMNCVFEVVLPLGHARFPFDVTGLAAKLERVAPASA